MVDRSLWALPGRSTVAWVLLLLLPGLGDSPLPVGGMSRARSEEASGAGEVEEEEGEGEEEEVEKEVWGG